MSYYGSIYEIPNGADTYSCNCVDGKCSNCGQCCSDMLPLTEGELRRIKRYAEEHHLKEHRQAPFWDPNATDMTCPFRNQQTKQCDIYPVRPQICRSFICSKPHDIAVRDRDYLHKGRVPRSLRFEVFNNPECLALIATVSAKKAGVI